MSGSGVVVGVVAANAMLLMNGTPSKLPEKLMLALVIGLVNVTPKKGPWEGGNPAA
jgi:hypothetical protein